VVAGASSRSPAERVRSVISDTRSGDGESTGAQADHDGQPDAHEEEDDAEAEERRELQGSLTSPRLVAILLAIDCPGWKTLGGTWSTFPMTMVTAIVSPMARPKASITPPKSRPVPSADHVADDSQWVARSRGAPRGVTSEPTGSPSREIATTIGTIMTASTIPAVKTENAPGLSGSSRRTG